MEDVGDQIKWKMKIKKETAVQAKLERKREKARMRVGQAKFVQRNDIGPNLSNTRTETLQVQGKIK